MKLNSLFHLNYHEPSRYRHRLVELAPLVRWVVPKELMAMMISVPTPSYFDNALHSKYFVNFLKERRVIMVETESYTIKRQFVCRMALLLISLYGWTLSVLFMLSRDKKCSWGGELKWDRAINVHTRAAKQIKAQKYFFVTSGTLVLLLFLTLAVQCECYVMRLYICSICFVMQHLASIPMQQYFPYLILGELATQSQQIQQDDEHENREVHAVTYHHRREGVRREVERA